MDAWISLDIHGHGYPWISMDIHGCLRISMDMHIHGWKPLDILGFPGMSKDIHAYALISMDIRGSPMVSMDIQGYPWISLDVHGYPWTSVDTHKYPWISVDMHGYPWTSIDTTIDIREYFGVKDSGVLDLLCFNGTLVLVYVPSLIYLVRCASWGLWARWCFLCDGAWKLAGTFLVGKEKLQVLWQLRQHFLFEVTYLNQPCRPPAVCRSAPLVRPENRVKNKMQTIGLIQMQCMHAGIVSMTGWVCIWWRCNNIH